MDSLYLIIFFILGTILGGFYTVLGNHLAQEYYHFLPYQCDSCNHNLSILDVIPFFSYLFFLVVFPIKKLFVRDNTN